MLVFRIFELLYYLALWLTSIIANSNQIDSYMNFLILDVSGFSNFFVHF